jgi:hypothetical protein
MKIINIKIKELDILFQFVPSLWRLRFMFIKTKMLTNKFYFNIMFLGFQFRLKIERHFKEVSITELKEIITKKKQESDKNK